MKTLYIVRGLPGSGKSTFAESVCEIVYSADMYFEDGMGNYNFNPSKLKNAHEWCRSAVESVMSLGHDVAVANTFTQEWEMKAYFDMAEKHGYTVFSLIVENRHGNENIHGVPEEAIGRMKKRFDVKL